jgi:hypothetical protein
MSENQTENTPKDNRNLLIGAIVVVALLLVVVVALLFATRGANQEPAILSTTEVAMGATATVTPEPEEPEEPTATVTAEPTEEPTEEPAPTKEPTTEPTEEPPAGLPPEPQEISFQAEDGQNLQGRYYPAAFEGAPMIVLMHWAGGDRNDWNEIAFWLQNRGLNGTSPNLGQELWLDPSWFPPITSGKSYAVFTFSFRGYEGGPVGAPPEWLLDAQAGVQAARELPGIDPERIAAIGASIGADGAVDGCGADNCLGALSLSPGSYLTLPYADAVHPMLEAEQTVWCFFATGDLPSAVTCQDISEERYQTTEWAGDRHGMRLLEPEVDPSAMQLILDFLTLLGL